MILKFNKAQQARCAVKGHENIQVALRLLFASDIRTKQAQGCNAVSVAQQGQLRGETTLQGFKIGVHSDAPLEVRDSPQNRVLAQFYHRSRTTAYSTTTSG